MNEARVSRPVCLSIGGSDSSGGAGIQADLRVFEALGTHGCSAITALTAQNPESVVRIEPSSLAQLDAEIHAVFDYYDVAVVKTGMLVDAEHIALISGLLSQLHRGALVIDPILVSSSGRPLLDAGAKETLMHALMPLATLITPNFDEADALFGKRGEVSVDSLKAMMERAGCAVLLKGGHGEGAQLIDRLCEPGGSMHEFEHARQAWSRDQCHGTGCRLASAISAYLAHGKSLSQSVDKAVSFLCGCSHISSDGE
ncbi:MAG: bifunctional hydroxymethylpyrimidine kinase/phosphomethylpyrimidine kinase [Mariprofundus sp.]|nr:bifunctional hydroxymethylpyrimidine kinase/phosphomethylpyrimidine kinase [Mariprofundus sp.]